MRDGRGTRRRRTGRRLAGAVDAVDAMGAVRAVGWVVAVLAAVGLAGACSPGPEDGGAGAGAGPGSTAAEARSGTLRVLSYNVAGLPEGISGSRPSVNTPLISPRLNAYDLVLVQEDWIDPEPPLPGVDFHHDDLVAAVDHPHRSTPVPPPVGTDPRRPTALVSDGLNVLSRWPVTEPEHVAWEGCFGGADRADGGAGDCLALKGFAVTTLTLAEGVEVVVVNLHAEAGGSPTDQQLQADDFRQLADHLNTRAAGRAVIVAGDTNLHTDGTHRDSAGTADRDIWRVFLAATGLADACDTLDCGADAGAIDKLALRSGGGVELRAVTHRFADDEFLGPDGSPLSDHRPLAVEVAWRAPA